MPNTTTWSITYPDSNSNLTPLEGHFQAIATTADTALSTLKTNIRGADSSSTLASLATSITATNTRLALNLQTSVGTPTGAPINSGGEGSMHWDSTNNILYIYVESAWKAVYSSNNWQNITVNSTFAASGSVPQYKIIGDIVYLRGAFTSAGFTAGQPGICGQLPAAAYPSSTVVYTGATSTSTANPSNRISVSGAGALTITPEAASGSHYINFSYPLG
jgi:hypothetical protein